MEDGNDRRRVGKFTWIGGGLAALALAAAGAAIAVPAAVAFDLFALLFSFGAVVAAGRALHQDIVLRRRAEKLSGEMDTLAARLLRIETRLAEPAPASGLTSTVAEVTGEIALLGGLVRDLAVTVATQDRDVASLREQIEKARPQAPAPALVPRAAAPSAPVIDLEQRARERAVIPSILPLSRPAAPQAEPASRPEPAPVRSEPAVRAVPPSPVRSAALAPEASDGRRLEAVMEALERDRIELHLQPVVSLPQRKSIFYEVLARVRLADDSILVPAEFLPLIERSGRIADFDRKILTRAAAIARHLAGRGSETKVSCNLSPASLEGGVLRAAGRIAEAYPDVADRLVLELSQRCWRSLDADTAGMIALLRGRGFSFALDRATDLRIDPLALAERGVTYVKLPADLLLQAETGRGLDIAVGDLAAVMTRAGIRLIAERVEREEDVPDLIDLDVPLAQGFVFAPPRAIRPEVLTPAQAATPAPVPLTPSAPAEAPPAPAGAVIRAPLEGEERRPFRAFLRRAG